MEQSSSELDQQCYMDNLGDNPEDNVATLHGNESLPDPPFRRLPSEIITEIFELCLPLDYNSDGFPNLAEPLFSKPPLSLGRVCRDWRSISQNTSSLWSGILITDKHPSLYPIIVEVVKEWIEHSHSSSLSIEFTAGFHDWRHPSKFPLHSVLLELTSQSTRWEHVSFSLGVIDFSLLAAIGHQLPELKTLRYSSTANAPSEFNLVNLEMAPKLSECSITVGNLHIKYGSPMSRLQVLEILEAREIGDFFNILDHCPFLIKLTICLTFSSSSTIAANEFTTRSMLHLRVLDLWSTSQSTDNDASSMWNFLHLPALKKFRYAASRAMPNVLPNIFSCLCRSQTDLRELYISGFPIDAQGLCTILGISPNLRRLMFQCRNSHSTDAILKALTVDPILPSVLCPQLQALEILTYVSSDHSVLINMLLSRSSGVLKAEEHLLRSRFGVLVKPLNALYLLRPLRVVNRQDPSLGSSTFQVLRERLPRDISLNFDTKEDLWITPGSEIDFSGEQVEALSLISTTCHTSRT